MSFRSWLAAASPPIRSQMDAAHLGISGLYYDRVPFGINSGCAQDSRRVRHARTPTGGQGHALITSQHESPWNGSSKGFRVAYAKT